MTSINGEQLVNKIERIKRNGQKASDKPLKPEICYFIKNYIKIKTDLLFLDAAGPLPWKQGVKTSSCVLPS